MFKYFRAHTAIVVALSIVLGQICLFAELSHATQTTPSQTTTYFNSHTNQPVKSPAVLQAKPQASILNKNSAFTNGYKSELPVVPAVRNLGTAIVNNLRRTESTVSTSDVLAAKTTKNDGRSLVGSRSKSLSDLSTALAANGGKANDEAMKHLYSAEKAHQGLQQVAQQLPSAHQTLTKYYSNSKKTDQLGGEMKTMTDIAADHQTIEAAKQKVGTSEYDDWKKKNGATIDKDLTRSYVNGQHAGDASKLALHAGVSLAVSAATGGIAAPLAIAALAVHGSKTATQMGLREGVMQKQQAINDDTTLTPEQKAAKTQALQSNYAKAKKGVDVVSTVALGGLAGGDFVGASASVVEMVQGAAKNAKAAASAGNAAVNHVLTKQQQTINKDSTLTPEQKTAKIQSLQNYARISNGIASGLSITTDVNSLDTDATSLDSDAQGLSNGSTSVQTLATGAIATGVTTFNKIPQNGGPNSPTVPANNGVAKPALAAVNTAP